MNPAIKDTAAFVSALGCALPDADGYVTPVTHGGSRFVFGYDPEASPRASENYKLRPTAVLRNGGATLNFWALKEPVPDSDPDLLKVVDALGMAGVDEPLPTPGVNDWSLEHYDLTARYPLSALIAAYVASADRGPTEGPEGASKASAANGVDDALAKILAGLGIDPANAYQGFRADHPFPVAVRLAMRGIRVLPTRVDTKIPCISGWPERATTDPAKLAWWQNRFNPNWSVLTGVDNDLMLLDVDGEKGLADLIELEEKLGKLPKTVKCISGRADGGCHFWLRTPSGEHDVRNQQPLPGTKIDVRGWHGHAVVAGSLHKSGKRYTWAPGCAPDEVEIAECPPAWWEWLPKKEHETMGGVCASRTKSHAPTRKRDHSSASLLIGDGAGFGGFQDPIYKNAIQYFFKVGIEVPVEPIIASLREIVIAAPKDYGRDVSRYLSGSDLPRIVERAREFVKQMKEAEND